MFHKVPLILTLSISSCILCSQPYSNSNKCTANAPADSLTAKHATIVAVGDIMFHKNQISSAFNGNTYNFNPSFEAIKKELQTADLCIGNFETTTNPKRSYSGYPCFNAPEQTLETLRNSGFDVLITTNNHSLDTGIDGLLSTASNVKKHGMLPIGTGERNMPKHAIWDANGIRIGVLAYTYGTNNSISGKKYSSYINIISSDKIRREIAAIRKDCDFIIVYLHIGTEYIRTIEKNQPGFFRAIADMGADCVLGSHPHVARESETYRAKDGREVFISYSLGNFISNMDRKYTDIGLMVKLEIKKTSSTRICCAESIPVYRHRLGNKVSVLTCEDAEGLNYISSITKKYINQVNNDLYYINSSGCEEVENAGE